MLFLLLFVCLFLFFVVVACCYLELMAQFPLCSPRAKVDFIVVVIVYCYFDFLLVL